MHTSNESVRRQIGVEPTGIHVEVVVCEHVAQTGREAKFGGQRGRKQSLRLQLSECVAVGFGRAPAVLHDQVSRDVDSRLDRHLEPPLGGCHRVGIGQPRIQRLRGSPLQLRTCELDSFEPGVDARGLCTGHASRSARATIASSRRCMAST